ncbi:hypothetical protein 8 [Diadegma semiclausum ichnovirus]|nr:hypothetical protein 8 [Diadegma semiclausum ichnovirus]
MSILRRTLQSKSEAETFAAKLHEVSVSVITDTIVRHKHYDGGDVRRCLGGMVRDFDVGSVIRLRDMEGMVVVRPSQNNADENCLFIALRLRGLEAIKYWMTSAGHKLLSGYVTIASQHVPVFRKQLYHQPTLSVSSVVKVIALRYTSTAELFTAIATTAYRQVFLQYREVIVQVENGRGLSCMTSTQLYRMQTSWSSRAAHHVAPHELQIHVNGH